MAAEPSTFPAAELAAVRAVIDGVNRAWRACDWHAVASFLHKDAVFVRPHSAGRSVGRADCVDSYRQFMAIARNVEYSEHARQFDRIGSNAIVTVDFEIAWTMDGIHHRERGRDLFVLTRQRGAWRIIWRTLVPLTTPFAPDRAAPKVDSADRQ